MEDFTKERLVQVHKRIQPYIHQTPVLTSRLINEIADCSIFFKCENFQKMGAFKMRGAINAILQLSEKDKQKGVVTHSSGNFAQALSLAAKSIGIPAYIVMPSNAPQVKKNAHQGHPILPARQFVPGRLGRKLASRHSRNGKPLLMD